MVDGWRCGCWSYAGKEGMQKGRQRFEATLNTYSPVSFVKSSVDLIVLVVVVIEHSPLVGWLNDDGQE